ncbi:MAG: hypothetical protein U5K71_03735 [Gracilimonas sp.]|nr:hypothetical protein [Gracilimonas sp.]
MEKVTQKDIDWLLNLDKPGTSVTENAKRPMWTRILWMTALGVCLILLPFFILVRTSVFLNVSYQVNGWVAIGAGITTTILLLLIYLLYAFKRMPNKTRILKFGAISISAIVTSFCIYGLIYLSSVNSKTEAVRSYYRNLHPILRVSVATVSLAARDFLITDIKRSPEDYLDMGLTPLQNSMHYPQNSGYVYAIDIRTIGKSEIRNKLLQFTFYALGFNTLRHYGTADHLHISLPLSH